MSEPTVITDPPGGAVIELLEVHAGPRMPDAGVESVLAPNHMRINGVGVYATQEAPAVLHEVEVDGRPSAPFTVTVQLMARALRVGGVPSYDPAKDLPARSARHAVVVEIPGVDGELEAGGRLAPPYVLINGHRLLINGPVRIGEIVTDGEKRTCAVVTIPLLCRRLVVDDESTNSE